jgi:hypothetical protein
VRGTIIGARPAAQIEELRADQLTFLFVAAWTYRKR